MRPIPMPWAMLKVSGIAKMVRTAGAAVSKVVHVDLDHRLHHEDADDDEGGGRRAGGDGEDERGQEKGGQHEDGDPDRG